MTDALLPGPAQAVVIRLTIKLDDAEPSIWRQLEIRGDLTLDLVHELLQAAMGWEDTHLHRFWRGSHAYQPEEPRFVTEVDIAEGDEGVLESEVRLDQVLRVPGDQLGYLYDFGDDWHHTLRVDEVLATSGTEPAAHCRDGRGACPPEDVGGIGTYNALVSALGATGPDPEDESLLEQYRDWLPQGFAPGRFDPVEATTAMNAAAETSTALTGLMSTPVVALRTLADRLDGEELALVAALARQVAATPVPTSQDVAGAMRPWQVLLDVVGPDGVALTAAGRLQPAVVRQLAHALGVDRWWIGKVNREDQTAPVARLRESAQAARLVRKYRGRLVRTPVGRRAASDPHTLWSHLAGALPLDRGDFEQEAGAAWLLCVAAGEADATGRAAQLLNAAGWRIDVDSLIEPRVVREAAYDTIGVEQIVRIGYRADAPRDMTAVIDAAAPVLRALAARAVVDA